MSDALDVLPDHLRSHPGAILATVIGVSGSTPASALARMLVSETGERLAGTVGGGCSEGDVIGAARGIAGTGKSAVLTFTLDEDHLESGMLCGGTLEVFLEPVSSRDLPLMESLRDRRDSGEDSIRATLLAEDGSVVDRFLLPPGDTTRFFPRFLPEKEPLLKAVEEVARGGNVRQVPVREGRLVIEFVPGAPALYIFGGGHVARDLSRIASLAGFSVTVIDDRSEFANPVRFPDAIRTVAADFIESFAQITIRPSSSIVIVTRGHKADEMVLERSVKTPAGYIGMIGSRTKVAATFERLASRGVGPEVLRRVHSPIGLAIGAVSPGEIAVSIVAELIHARRTPGAPLGFKSDPPGRMTNQNAPLRLSLLLLVAAFSPGRALTQDFLIDLPDTSLARTYERAAVQNVLAAVNPQVFFGYFSVCADGHGFGYGNTYPSLDGHQLSDALLWLGQVGVVEANWQYVRSFQRDDGLLPIAIFPALPGKDIGPKGYPGIISPNGATVRPLGSRESP